MDDDDTRQMPVTSAVRTAEQPVPGAQWAPPAAAPLLGEEDEDDWMALPPARGVRVRVPTAVLLALGLAAGGFWAGAVVQRHDGSSASSGTSALAARLRAGGFARSGASGAGGLGAGGLGAATRGTVIDVAGPVVALTDSSTSAIDKFRIGPSTTVTRTGDGAPGSLQIGDTVIVRGTAGAGGVIAATSVVATAAGVTAAGAGGAAGGAGFAGGAAGGG